MMIVDPNCVSIAHAAPYRFSNFANYTAEFDPSVFNRPAQCANAAMVRACARLLAV
jgi:hypothetical protein